MLCRQGSKSQRPCTNTAEYHYTPKAYLEKLYRESGDTCRTRIPSQEELHLVFGVWCEPHKLPGMVKM